MGQGRFLPGDRFGTLNAGVKRAHAMKVLLYSFLSAVLLAGTYAAVSWPQSAAAAEDARSAAALASRRALEREIRIRAATGEADLNPLGWPTTIDPAWFAGSPPRNPYLDNTHPWIEIATPAEAALLDPPIRQALTADIASYWYNPANGVIRIRVGPCVTDARAIDLYNRLNGGTISALFSAEPTRAEHASAQPAPPRRQPSRVPRSAALSSGGDRR